MTATASPTPVLIGARSADELLDHCVDAASQAAGDIVRSLAVAVDIEASVPMPATGSTLRRWEVLATLGAADLTVARVVEPHLDAIAILAEARDAGLRDNHEATASTGRTWGVFASEAPPTDLAVDSREHATGTKAWCSLAGSLTNALITASSDAGGVLVAVDLSDGGVLVEHASGWRAHGLPDVTSTPIHLENVAVDVIGPAGWYVHRPGFWWGGIGVAACWYGASVAIGRSAFATARKRRSDIASLQFARIDLALGHARLALADAAARADAGPIAEGDLTVLAARTRAVCAAAAETVMSEAGHLLGPGPLAFDPVHAQRIADLTLYVRQHHADRDLATLGRDLVAFDDPPW